ncbi:hypothetical protein EDB92DRAFT_1466846 [Lactarius akahatsu]|uniref:Uncharacterized protein n=1 Tax=Lactarius akahatsu TaxID=416441 RepID=A0AAD4LAK6_9AGAM|nr:hypothetical protein EDB92DRAFT_1466846 [Lactarius akahatsu]
MTRAQQFFDAVKQFETRTFWLWDIVLDADGRSEFPVSSALWCTPSPPNSPVNRLTSLLTSPIYPLDQERVSHHHSSLGFALISGGLPKLVLLRSNHSDPIIFPCQKQHLLYPLEGSLLDCSNWSVLYHSRREHRLGGYGRIKTWHDSSSKELYRDAPPEFLNPILGEGGRGRGTLPALCKCKDLAGSTWTRSRVVHVCGKHDLGTFRCLH